MIRVGCFVLPTFVEIVQNVSKPECDKQRVFVPHMGTFYYLDLFDWAIYVH